MKVYVIIVQDHHADVEVEVYADKDRAISKARLLAVEYGREHTEDYEEKQIADWCFHATYSCEGDCVTVLEKTINE